MQVSKASSFMDNASTKSKFGIMIKKRMSKDN